MAHNPAQRCSICGGHPGDAHNSEIRARKGRKAEQRDRQEQKSTGASKHTTARIETRTTPSY